MTWLSDGSVARLRAVAETPDTGGTRYRIVKTIGRGGMGVVYEAEDLVLGRRVALKVLATEVSTPESSTRMREEAKTIAQLEHPGIAPVYDAGELADGRVFYAMKLVRGRRLDQITGSSNDLLRMFVRLCETVAFAHARGVVHCDLKPENIMTGEFGEVFVMDWGVARAIGDRAIAGTREFMSPEQASGGCVDAATDVYSIGAMLRRTIVNPPKPLRAVIAKATATQRTDRYADATMLGRELVRYLDGAPLEAWRAPVAERVWRWIVRNRALLAIIAAYLIMRVIVIFSIHR